VGLTGRKGEDNKSNRKKKEKRDLVNGRHRLRKHTQPPDPKNYARGCKMAET